MNRLVVVGVCSLALVASVHPAAARAPEPPAQVARTIEPRSDGKGRGAPFSLTLSGGISLGAYEAGLNWALLEWLKTRQDPRVPDGPLMGVSGASAGAINALLSVMRWCEEARTTSIDGNLFSQTWRAVGLDDPKGLLPGNDDDFVEVSAADPGWDPDFIVGRKHAFTDVFAAVRAALKKPIYAPGCRVRLSLMVTKAQPKQITVENITTHSQRLVIPLVLVVDAAKTPHFELNRELLDDDRQRSLLGEVLLPAPDPKAPDRISTEEVLTGVLASSAHPSSFGPVLLKHCTPAADCPTGRRIEKENGQCAGYGELVSGDDGDGSLVMCAEPFVDGGAFDNVPLGMAMAQVESAAFPSGKPAASLPVRYIYLDPGVRRESAKRPCEPAKAPPGARPANAGQTTGESQPPTPARDPITELLTFVKGMYSSASEYELHNVMRFNRWNLTPSRVGAKIRKTATAVCARPTRAGNACDGLKARLDEVDEQARSLDAREARSDAAGWLQAFPGFLEAVKSVITAIAPAASATQGVTLERLKVELDDLKQSPSSARELQIPTRFPPLTGALLANFAAFFDRPFRDYDYYAGIYDGIAAVADWNCEGCDWPTRSEMIQTWKKNLGVAATGGPVASVVEKLFDRENQLMTNAPTLICADASHPVQRDEARLKSTHERLEQIRASLEDPSRCGYHAGICLKDENFNGLLVNLKTASYQAASELTAWAVDSPDDWWTAPMKRAVAHLELVNEHETLDQDTKAEIGVVTGVASLVAQHSYNAARDPWYFRPLSDSSYWWARVLSPSIAIATTTQRYLQVGIPNYAFGWRSFVIAGEGSLRFGVTDEMDRQRFSSFDVTAGPSVLTGWWHLSSLNARAGHTIFEPYGTVPFPVSYEAGVGFLYDHLRLSAGLDSADWTPHWDHKYLKIAITDVAGLLQAIF